ncbi:hypothetical protein EZV62_003490 [Acer yangbiense]|uniref:TIR domain-containing protein n=1 Tax=Acer yangbiense TaxID=1000413 RepID=A0A5C7IHJ5_9ROSI|nr:hypothetical protein EZV62_003490 [Acer yangbiense]
MALISNIPSSSSSNTSKFKNDVFISFRGKDTRYNFTSHLHKALRDKQIQTYIDDKLNRGDEISPSLLKAIEESQISVIIFSKDYASSRWCLEELVKILECKKRYGQIVIPVFYNVVPTDVRNQTGTFGDAFTKHYQKQSLDQVQRWKDALNEAANLSGLESSTINYFFLCAYQGSEMIEAISLNMSSSNARDINLTPRAFVEMEKLRLLKFYVSNVGDNRGNKVHAPDEGFEYVFNELKYLHWYGFPLNSLQPNFQSENLVTLEMPNSNVEELWSDCESLTNIPDCTGLKSLKQLFLTYCTKLKRLPDLPNNVETLDFIGCESLVEIPSSFKYLYKVKYLNLIGCDSLAIIPDLRGWKSLKQLRGRGCLKLKMLPEVPNNIETIDLDNTLIEELPPSFEDLSSLKYLDLKNSSMLKSLPSSICKLKSLETLRLHNCPKIDKLPDNIGTLESLTEIDATGTAIREILPSISCLKRLYSLDFSGCTVLGMQGLATTIEELYESYDQVYYGESPPAYVRYLENDIPEWFSFRSPRSFIDVKLPPHWFNYNFICLAMSVVVTISDPNGQCDHQGDYYNRHFHVRYEGVVKSKDGDQCCDRINVFRGLYSLVQVPYSGTDYIRLNQVTMGFGHCFFRELCDDEFSFRFYVTDWDGSNIENIKVVKCGVHLIFGLNLETSRDDAPQEIETYQITPRDQATKPMEETPKATKPRSKPASKRPSETDGAQKDSKRAKKKGTEADGDEEEALESKKPREDTKKQLFQRLWSEDDEIVVLKGMIEFSTKKGVDPNQDMKAFHDFIKKSLHIDVSRTQLVDKIIRLRKKYENNLERGIKKGEVRTFSKPHEQKAYDLSKKVWGGEGGVPETASKSNGKARKTQNQRVSSKQLAASKVESVNGPKDVEKMDVDNDKELSLKTPVDVEKFLFDNSLGVTGFEDYVVKNGLAVIKGSKKTELEQRWKKLHIAQLELYVERIDLVKEQALLVLESLKSSDAVKSRWQSSRGLFGEAINDGVLDVISISVSYFIPLLSYIDQQDSTAIGSFYAISKGITVFLHQEIMDLSIDTLKENRGFIGLMHSEGIAANNADDSVNSSSHQICSSRLVICCHMISSGHYRVQWVGVGTIKTNMAVKPTFALRAMLVGGIAVFAKVAGAMKAAGGVKLRAAATAMSMAAAAMTQSKDDPKSPSK